MSKTRKLCAYFCLLLLLSACGKSADELYQEGRAQLDESNYAAAVPLLKKSIEKDPSISGVHNALGVAYLRIDSLNASILAFNRSIEIDSTSYKPFYNRGNAKRLLGLDQEAMVDYNKAIEINPSLADAYTYRGTIYAKYQDFDNALFDFGYSLQLNNSNPLVYMYKGRIELVTENVEDAMYDLKKAVELKSDLGEAWYWMGLAQLASNNLPEGCGYLQTASENGYDQANMAIAQNCMQ